MVGTNDPSEVPLFWAFTKSEWEGASAIIKVWVSAPTVAPIGESKRLDTVATVVRSEQGEQCLILIDRQKPALAHQPAPGGVVEGESLYGTEVWL